MTMLYCDCFSGISGDMFLGALLDAGLPAEYLDQQFRSLGLAEYHGVGIQKVKKGTIQAGLLDLDFHISEHHHDHAGDVHDHHHDHQRNFIDIKDLIEQSGLKSTIKDASLRIFQILAEAEARVHGTTLEEVNFHEVGAVDSILDIVGAAAGMEYFGITQVYSSPIPLGSGNVMTQHGLLPLPAPATAELMRIANMPIVPSQATTELVTPTGAAILAATARFEQPSMKLDRVGVGAGRRDLEWPNILRVFIGEPVSDQSSHVEIETNIDDMNPQLFNPVMAALFEAGALDVYFTPIYMKKNRPATKLSVIARKEDEEQLSDLILHETTSLGVRVREVHRYEAERRMEQVETPYGKVAVKLKIVDGQVIQASPEFDECVQRAKEAGVSPSQVLLTAQQVANGLIE